MSRSIARSFPVLLALTGFLFLYAGARLYAASYGTCEGLMDNGPKLCVDVNNCRTPGSCTAESVSCGDGTCNPNPCPFTQWIRAKRYGTHCGEASPIDRCITCTTWWCAQGQAYSGMDVDYACIGTGGCIVNLGLPNVCIPRGNPDATPRPVE